MRFISLYANQQNKKKSNPFSDNDEDPAADPDPFFGDDDDDFLLSQCAESAEANEDINAEGHFVGNAQNDGSDPQLSRTDYNFSDGLKRCGYIF